MHPIKKIMNTLEPKLPRYNEFLLRGFMIQQIEGAAEFIDTMFKEAIKLFDGRIEYRGYRTMSPENRANYELRPQRDGGGCHIAESDLILMEYIFAYDGKEYPVPLYIPYLRNDVIMIEDTICVPQRSIKEQTFSRISHGVTIKVLRQPIKFYIYKQYRLESVTDDWFSHEVVPTTTIYNKSNTKSKKIPVETVVHYLLCKFGYLGVLEQFGLKSEDAIFTTHIENDIEEYRYFAAKSTGNRTVKKKIPLDLFLKVKKEKLTEPLTVKLIASILYTLTGFQKHTVEHLYDPSGTVFRILLGKIIFSNVTNEQQNKNKVDTHISSVDSYLDPITQSRLLSYGIHVENIYDVFKYVFTEIEQLSRTSYTNLYTTRIDYIEEILVETIVKNVYSSWYMALRRMGGSDIDPSKFRDKDSIVKIVRIRDDLVTRLRNSQIVQKSPPAYGDNALPGWLIPKMRWSSQSKSGKVIGSPDHQFDPSILTVESLIAFSKTNPSAAGSINPYLQITPTGGVIRSDYSDEIDNIRKYLP